MTRKLQKAKGVIHCGDLALAFLFSILMCVVWGVPGRQIKGENGKNQGENGKINGGNGKIMIRMAKSG